MSNVTTPVADRSAWIRCVTLTFACFVCVGIVALLVVDYAYGHDEKVACTVIRYTEGHVGHGIPSELVVRADDGRELLFGCTPALQPGDRCTITWRHGAWLGEFRGLPTVTYRRLPTAAETDS